MIDVQRSDASATCLASSTGNFLRNPHCVAIQFRYAFVTDDDGLKVLDITDPDAPDSGDERRRSARRIAGRLYVARTYAYVANGAEGLAIIDVENPERPRLDQMFNAGGVLNDTRAVQIGSVNASQFALVADGRKWLARRPADLARHRPRRARIQSATKSGTDRDTIRRKAKQSPSRAGSIAIGWWMKLAGRRWSSAGAVRGHFNYPKCCRSSDVSRPANFTSGRRGCARWKTVHPRWTGTRTESNSDTHRFSGAGISLNETGRVEAGITRRRTALRVVE